MSEPVKTIQTHQAPRPLPVRNDAASTHAAAFIESAALEAKASASVHQPEPPAPPSEAEVSGGGGDVVAGTQGAEPASAGSSTPLEPPAPAPPPPAGAVSPVAPIVVAPAAPPARDTQQMKKPPADLGPDPEAFMGEEKGTYYTTAASKSRLRHIAMDHRVGEAIVVGYALDRLLRSMSNEEIAMYLRSRGYGMRRPS